MPSAESRSKLKAYQFIEGRPTAKNTLENEKENALQDQHSNYTAGQTELHKIGLPENCVRPASQEACAPATPATRLPLADLIGNVDEAAQPRRQPDISPEDHLHWMPSSSFNSSKTPANRSKKRARSSSPISSQHEPLAQFTGERQKFDLANVKQSLRTPQADPLADLWNRYVPGTSNRDAPNAEAQPTLQNLMNECSPRSPGMPASNKKSGLRRWTSEGNQWMNHKTKKRKTTASVYREQIEGVLADHTTQTKETAAGSPIPSRVGFLVDCVQKTLLKQPSLPRDHDDPSSSSPLPEHGALRNDPSQLTSPLQRLAPAVEEHSGSKANDNTPSRPARHAGLAQESKRSGHLSVSDCDSEDLTIGMLQTMESATARTCITASQQCAVGDIDAFVSNDVTRPAPPEASALLQDAQDLENFFDDVEDEGDEFAADMETFASIYDERRELARSQPSLYEPTYVQQRAKIVAVAGRDANPVDKLEKTHQAAIIDEEDDDFGSNDIDDAAFATAEVMATQSHETNVRGRPSVSRTLLNTPPPTS